MYKVVDLFAGPGGLAEGFSSVREADGSRTFEVALSVEKEASAFATLQLRAFFRQFDGNPPDDYYAYLSGELAKADLYERHPIEWARARTETLQLELGAPGSRGLIDPLLDEIREADSAGAVLVGGPPCQAYSLVGRARNSGNPFYVPREDHRHFLYREYIRILERLRPSAFVLENVKGFLSASVDGDSIFARVMSDLEAPGGHGLRYQIVPLVESTEGGTASQFVVEAERYGVPQRRHRVILFGIRADLVKDGPLLPVLPSLRSRQPVSVEEALGGMPKLRSGLSRLPDSWPLWRECALSAFSEAARACRDDGTEVLRRVAERLSEYGDLISAHRKLARSSSKPVAPRSRRLSDWLVDTRLTTLSDHDSRSHMESDLKRYAFAATFAEVAGRSPTARDFPSALAPAHRSWKSDKFNDRFRVQQWSEPSSTLTSHIAKDGHYFIHPDPLQCRSLTMREAARLQTFPDNYKFEGNRTQQFTQVGNAVPPLLARTIGLVVAEALRAATKRSSLAA